MMATIMLMLLRILMPLSTPVDAERRKHTVNTARIMKLMVVEVLSVPNTELIPERTIRVPIAREPASPNITATTARMSAADPIPLRVGRLKMFLNPTSIGVEIIDGSPSLNVP